MLFFHSVAGSIDLDGKKWALPPDPPQGDAWGGFPCATPHPQVSHNWMLLSLCLSTGKECPTFELFQAASLMPHFMDSLHTVVIASC
jgi:hypothetical protein